MVTKAAMLVLIFILGAEKVQRIVDLVRGLGCSLWKHRLARQEAYQLQKEGLLLWLCGKLIPPWASETWALGVSSQRLSFRILLVYIIIYIFFSEGLLILHSFGHLNFIYYNTTSFSYQNREKKFSFSSCILWMMYVVQEMNRRMNQCFKTSASIFIHNPNLAASRKTAAGVPDCVVHCQ